MLALCLQNPTVMLENEFDYFLSHQEELVSKYPGKFIVIVGDVVKEVADTEEKAYTEAIKHFEPGTFLIQKCVPGEESYTQVFNSHISF